MPALTYSESGLVNGDTGIVFTGTLATSATAASSVGTYVIVQGSLSAAPNYDIAFTSGTLSVNPAALTITADDASKTYGAVLPSFEASYSGLVNNDSTGVVSGLRFSTTATAASNAGTYAIVPGGATASNYAISYVSGTLTVNAAPLSVTADNLGKTYGAAVPALTYTFTGLVNGDSAAVFSALTTPATADANVGTYAITQGSLSAGGNYAIRYVGGILTVVPATLTVTANDASQVYGTPLPGFDASFRGLVNGDTPSSLSGILSFSTPATSSSPVGMYPVTPGGLASVNYGIHFVAGTLSVTPAPSTTSTRLLRRPPARGGAIPGLARSTRTPGLTPARSPARTDAGLDARCCAESAARRNAIQTAIAIQNTVASLPLDRPLGATANPTPPSLGSPAASPTAVATGASPVTAVAAATPSGGSTASHGGPLCRHRRRCRDRRGQEATKA